MLKVARVSHAGRGVIVVIFSKLLSVLGGGACAHTLLALCKEEEVAVVSGRFTITSWCVFYNLHTVFDKAILVTNGS